MRNEHRLHVASHHRPRHLRHVTDATPQYLEPITAASELQIEPTLQTAAEIAHPQAAAERGAPFAEAS